MASPGRLEQAPAGPPGLSLSSLLTVAAWLGITTGFLEGLGLLLFQRINWARWGPMIHVSEEILWISPIVCLCFFSLVALLAGLVGKLAPRLLSMRTVAWLLTFLAAYDWLTLTSRVEHRACLLLSAGVAFACVRWLAAHESEVLQFCRRYTPWLLACLILVVLGIQSEKWLAERGAVAALPAVTPGAPNVLVIVVDTLRADHVSSYGYARPTSPNLDRLAQQGALFENAFATCSWSLPSHVSLLTGRYEYEHGVGNVQPMPWTGWGSNGLGGFPTLGEALEQKGYRTGAFSANRTYFTADLGFGRGFVHFEDYFHSPADMFVRTLWGREFARLYLNRSDKSKVKRALRFLGMDSLLDKDSEGSAAFGGAQGVRKRASVINDEVLRWIDRDRQRPFFVFLNYFDVHFPYGGPPIYPKPGWDHGGSIDEYDASVSYVDDYLGRLTQELERRGVLNDTLIVVTSDHGESLGQHGLTYHAQALYLELIRVPLIIRYPGRVPAGVRVAAPVSNVTIAASIMDLLGTKTRDAFSGPPLRQLWEAPAGQADWPPPLSELAQTDIMDKEDKVAGERVPTAASGSMKSLVTPQSHLIVHDKLGNQLYDWRLDTGESNNLVSTPEGHATALSLSKQLERTTKVTPKKQP